MLPVLGQYEVTTSCAKEAPGTQLEKREGNRRRRCRWGEARGALRGDGGVGGSEGETATNRRQDRTRGAGGRRGGRTQCGFTEVSLAPWDLLQKELPSVSLLSDKGPKGNWWLGPGLPDLQP